jgi:hypothetical protein
MRPWDLWKAIRSVLVHGHPVAGKVQSDVAHMQEIVGEVLLDEVALVAEAHHEFLHPVRGIQLHDVPQDGPAAYLDHGLGPGHRLFAQPGPEAAGQNHCLHPAPSLCRLPGGLPVAIVP